jgi:hypothetical protein
MAKSLTFLRFQSRKGGLEEEVNEERMREKGLVVGVMKGKRERERDLNKLEIFAPENS